MALSKHIIADSGGSSTTWAFLQPDGTIDSLQTGSMHPKYVLGWNEEKWQELATQLGTIEKNSVLSFYGSGCSQPEIREQLAAGLRALGFGEVHIYPDSLGACRACCLNEPGMVAILGTGSVLLEYDGKEIVNRIGGYGSLIGDEGSGFHFARLVVRDYLDGKIAGGEAEAVLGAKGEVLARLASPAAQEWLATIAGKLVSPEWADYHRRNLEAFLENHVGRIPDAKTKILHVIGSYGFYQQEALSTLLEGRGWKLGEVIQNPIERLVKFHRREEWI